MQYELKQKVENTVSGEAGEVIGRAEYSHAEPSYFVRHKAADGRASESWWSESSVKAVDAAE